MIANTTRQGPTLIAIGLALLLAAQIWPMMPIAAAAMLIALGATRALAARTSARESARGLMTVHLMTYAALYSLLVGASLDRSLRVYESITWATAADLMIATCLLALVVRQALPVFRDGTANRC
jgi:ABC-type Mn2+/Zn2+ transport system permease subunit